MRHQCLTVCVVFFLCLVLFFVIVLILALTLFKVKEPKIQLLSSTVRGVAPSIPSHQLNITLDLQFQVENPNRASFRHGMGKSLLLYQGNQVGDANIYPGFIPAMGSATVACQLTFQVDKIASNLTALVLDALDGKVDLETQMRIPGRVTVLGFIKKHIVAVSDCQFAIAVPTFKVQNQTCKSTAKL